MTTFEISYDPPANAYYCYIPNNFAPKYLRKNGKMEVTCGNEGRFKTIEEILKVIPRTLETEIKINVKSLCPLYRDLKVGDKFKTWEDEDIYIKIPVKSGVDYKAYNCINLSTEEFEYISEMENIKPIA